jgi:predicted signal transduction protein with EAL and GGDEF domain
VRLLHALHRPFVLDGVSVPVSGSIGVSLSPLHGDDVSTIMKRADVAMYAAKQGNGGLRLYEPTMDSHSPERLALLAELRHAVETNQLEIHVQPKVDLRDGSLSGVEALARWEHSQQGEVSPTEFIPVAERSGLIRPLTLSVLRSALAACARWRSLGHEIGVAVNLSARNLLDDALVDDVRRLLRQHVVPARLLTLEITESSVMTDPEQAMSILRQLRAMGVRLSLDDFGTGYSSLSYLNRLPVDEVKIDRSFVTDMCRNPDEATIVRSIVDLGSSLDLNIVAEGVEDLDTRDALARMGCDSAQGFQLGERLIG